MFARALSGAVVGLEACSVAVESYRGKGLPGLTLIGLARGAVRESCVRVRSALVASGIQLGTQRLVVNLLPAELPKDASALDLPLAVSLLASAGKVDGAALKGRRFYGELSLGGSLEPVRGGVLLADMVRRCGEQELILPMANAAEAAIIPGVRVFGASHLREVVAHLTGGKALKQVISQSFEANGEERVGCFRDVRGQFRAKRALELAAAGGHNVLMIGPPGSGKTMLARRLSGVLPALNHEESIEVTRICSAAGCLGERGLVRLPPFRMPHHTASDVALCGGGSTPRPGEITMAHRGVLFLDELPEFSRRALESLREPLEEGSIHIARAAMTLRFPASVLLVAAMNPCPCGYFRGDLGSESTRSAQEAVLGNRPCMCSFAQIQRYRNRISGPLLDRIDLHVGVDTVPYAHFAAPAVGRSSGEIAKSVSVARACQQERLGSMRCNANMDGVELQRYVPLQPAILSLIERGIAECGLSSRAIGRVLKVARTIADLAGQAQVQPEHVAEAMGLRLLGGGGLPLVSA